MKKVLFALTAFSVFVYGEMEIHKQLIHLFSQEPLPTEEKAYNCLKQNPIACDYTYVAIPWVVLLNKRCLGAVQIPHIEQGFAICQHIHFRKILPLLKKMHVSVLFTPHAEEKSVNGITIVPFPHVTKNSTPPAEKKDIWFSFIGRQTHVCRKFIFKLPPLPNVVIKRVTAALDEEYRDVLARSRFSLCPRGTGPSSIRFWESLQAGAIPVIIADAMHLPPNFDWERCIIRVPENQIASIPEILKQIPIEQEKSMRQASLEAYEKFSGDQLVSVIRHYFEHNL